MTAETKCDKCRQLHDAYHEAALRYMRFHDGMQADNNDGERLLTEMKDAKQALFAHQDGHAL